MNDYELRKLCAEPLRKCAADKTDWNKIGRHLVFGGAGAGTGALINYLLGNKSLTSYLVGGGLGALGGLGIEAVVNSKAAQQANQLTDDQQKTKDIITQYEDKTGQEVSDADRNAVYRAQNVNTVTIPVPTSVDEAKTLVNRLTGNDEKKSEPSKPKKEENAIPQIGLHDTPQGADTSKAVTLPTPGSTTYWLTGGGAAAELYRTIHNKNKISTAKASANLPEKLSTTAQYEAKYGGNRVGHQHLMNVTEDFIRNNPNNRIVREIHDLEAQLAATRNRAERINLQGVIGARRDAIANRIAQQDINGSLLSRGRKKLGRFGGHLILPAVSGAVGYLLDYLTNKRDLDIADKIRRGAR